jgi:heme exporter protein CcmD
MTHAIFVLPAYALGVLVPVGFAAQAALRLRRARRRLAVLEPQGRGRQVA